MNRTDPPNGKCRTRKMSRRRTKRANPIAAGLCLAVAFSLLFPVKAWGVSGTLWRLTGLAAVVVGIWLAWRNRRRIWAHIVQRHRDAAARAAAAAAALARAETVRRLVRESTDDQGRTLITIRKAAESLGLEGKGRYGPAESRRFGETFEECGYCLEPDARLTERGYAGDEVVTAFPRATDAQTTTTRYAAAACMLRLGLVVAAADGHVHPDELAALLGDLEGMFELNDHERRRLEALRTLVTATGPDLAGLSRMAKTLNVEHREAIAKLLLVLAAKDGVVTREEIQAIRKCYKTLGFAQTEIGHALNALRAYQSDEKPVTVRPGTAGAAGEAIPAPAQKPVLTLNRAAIAQIMADTRDVARMLAEAMNAGEQPAQAPFSTPFVAPAAAEAAAAATAPTVTATASAAAAASPAAQAEVDPTLPARFAGFYQILISRKEWDVKDISDMARQQGLMLNGALDALNEWAAQKHGGQLFVEDGPKLYVEQAYLS
jgi:uncharacterized tellurite resistance protein B-like protein